MATVPALPSLLLRRRPDVLAAEAELAAAARARFPRLTLSATLGLLAFDLGKLFDDQSRVGSVSGGLLAPLVDFGRIEAQQEGAQATRAARLAAYRGAVFAALGEAEAAYGLVDATRVEALAARQEADQLARAAQLAESRYRAGLADFLTVIESRRAADTSAERAAIAHGAARRARVLLWQALGGSDQPANLSTSQ